MEKKEVEFVLRLHKNDFEINMIAKLTNLSTERIKEILKKFPT